MAPHLRFVIARVPAWTSREAPIRDDRHAAIACSSASELGSGRAASFEAAAQGAAVAWGPSGCGGFCGFNRSDETHVARIVAAGRPTIQHTKKSGGSMSKRRGVEGLGLLFVEDAVRWGDLLAWPEFWVDYL